MIINSILVGNLEVSKYFVVLCEELSVPLWLNLGSQSNTKYTLSFTKYNNYLKESTVDYLQNKIENEC